MTVGSKQASQGHVDYYADQTLFHNIIIQNIILLSIAACKVIKTVFIQSATHLKVEYVLSDVLKFNI